MNTLDSVVSVITPNYNSRKYIQDTFFSLLKQSFCFSKINWIVVDNCSTDGSFDILQKIAKRHRNIDLLQTSANSGSAGLPRNIALSRVKTPYILFLDADDMLAPTAIETLLDIISKHDVGLASTAFGYLNISQEIKIEQRYSRKREGYYQIYEQIDEWYPIANPFFTKLFRNTVIQDHNLTFVPSLRIGEDSLFLFQYMQHIKKAYHVNEITYNYRIRSDSATHLINKTYFENYLFAIKKMRQILSDSKAFIFYEKFIDATIPPVLDLLLNAVHIPNEDCFDILEKLEPFMQCVEDRDPPKGVQTSAIFIEDAKRQDFSAVKFHFSAVRTLCTDHQAQLDSIFTSRSWRLLIAFRRLLGR